MAVITKVVLEGVTPAQYDAIREACGWLETPPTGGMAHLTWFQDGACHNIDCWESEEAFGAFGEQRLGPAMAAAGVAVEPQVTFQAAHEVFLPAATTVTV